MHTEERYVRVESMTLMIIIVLISSIAEIDYVAEATLAEVSLNISCTMIVLYSKDVAQVTIEVANQQNFIVKRLPLKCNGNSTSLKYSNLISGTNYNISAVWTTEDNSICALGSTFTMSCELT